MPNQANFRTDVTTPTTPRYTASRIVRFSDELVLSEELPASFAFDKDDVIEVHFYTIPTNQRILSTVINLNDGMLKSHIVSYSDNTNKNYIRIDFTKLFKDKNLVLVPSDYRMVLNFFSNEIGDYDNRKLSINIISPSRTEVEVFFNDTADEVMYERNRVLLREFAEKSFNRSDAVGLAETIFNPGSREQLLETDIVDAMEYLGPDTNVITPPVIAENIDIALTQTYETTFGRVDRVGLREIFDAQITDFLAQLYTFIKEEIIINGDERIQEDEYREIVRKMVKQHIVDFRQTVDSRITVK